MIGEDLEPAEATGPDLALRRLRAVHALMAGLYEADSLPAFYQQAVDAVVTTLGADRASLLLYDPDGVMRFKAWRGLSETYRRAVEGHTPWSPDDAAAAPILVSDVAADPALAELLPVFRQAGIAALAFVPLTHKGRLVGKFMLYYDQPHDFSPGEVVTGEIFAAQVALALERRRIEDEEHAARLRAEASAARLAGFQRVTAELSRAVRTDDIADVVLGTALRESGASSGSLCLLDGDELKITYAVGYPEAVKGHWGRFPLNADLPASEAVRSNQAVFIHSPEERDARYPVLASTPVVDDKSFAIIPLADREPIGCLVLGYAEARHFSVEDEDWFLVLAARCTAALERARLYEDREQALLAEAVARARVSFLAEVSQVLASSLDYELTLHTVTELTVPRLADWCAIYLRGDGGEIVPVAIAHSDPERVRLVRQLLDRYPVDPKSPAGIAAVIRTGRPQVFSELGDDLLVQMAQNEEHLELMRSVGLGSGMVMPLRSRGRVFGAFSMANQAGRLMDPDDPALAEELARRAAVAIDNARLFQERTEIAQTLQASLLPPELPGIPGVELGARYAAAGSGVEVGGDFYDVFHLDARRFVVVVGDVCGRGVQAATLAALTRHTIRSGAVTQSDPGAILAHANEVLIRSQPADGWEPRFCTAVVAVIDPGPDGVSASVACGGHPLPLLRRADGTVTPVGTAGSLLGVIPGATTQASRVLLRPGDALVCVTDGVLERRHGEHFFGEERLAAVVAGSGAGGAQDLAAAVEAATVSFAEQAPSDDLAVLVLRVPD